MLATRSPNSTPGRPRGSPWGGGSGRCGCANVGAWLPPHVEAAHVLTGGLPGNTNVADMGGGWALPEQGEQSFERRARSLRQYLDAAVALVASVSAQAERLGLLYDEVAKADALHLPVDVGVKFFIWSVSWLAHTGHDSIFRQFSAWNDIIMMNIHHVPGKC